MGSVLPRGRDRGSVYERERERERVGKRASEGARELGAVQFFDEELLAEFFPVLCNFDSFPMPVV